MTLPPSLQDAINRAGVALARDPRSTLALPLRREVWSAMGPWVRDDDGFAEGVGYLRRTDLSAAATKKVLSHWTAAFPQDARPERILKSVDEYLRGNIDSDELWDGANIDDFVAWLEDQDHPAVAVGFAAVHTALVALSDESVTDEDGNELPADTTDDDLDYTDWSSEYLGAIMASGGPPSDPSSDIDARRAFWTWYLDVAVPAAYSYYDDADYE